MLLRLLAIAAFVPVLMLAVACGDDDDDDGGGGDDGGAATTAPAGDDGGDEKTLSIAAADFAFDPAELAAGAGETVTVAFANEDSALHSFTIDGVVEVEAGAGASATSEPFIVPEGDVMFYCKYHPSQMQGMLVVDGSARNIEDEEDDGGGSIGFGY